MLIASIKADLKGGANTPSMMQVVFVLTEAYDLEISLSRKAFFRREFKWFDNVTGTLCCTWALAAFTSPCVTYIQRLMLNSEELVVSLFLLTYVMPCDVSSLAKEKHGIFSTPLAFCWCCVEEICLDTSSLPMCLQEIVFMHTEHWKAMGSFLTALINAWPFSWPGRLEPDNTCIRKSEIMQNQCSGYIFIFWIVRLYLAISLLHR